MKPIYRYLPLFFSLLTFGLLTTSCADDIDGPDIPQTSGSLEIPFEVDGEMPLARGVLSQRHETALNHVYILYFDIENENVIAGYSSVSVNSNKSTISFDPPTSLEVNHPYRILSIGNSTLFAGEEPMKNKIEAWISGGKMTYDMIERELVANYDEPLTAANPGQLPMWGKFYTDKTAVQEADFLFSRDEKGNAVSENEGLFRYTRAVCRIDIHNLVGHILKIESARVVNYNVSGNYYYDYHSIPAVTQDEFDKFIPEMSAFVPTSAPGGEGYMPITTDMIPGENTTQWLQGSLYCFPNAVGTSVVNDSKTTALIIAGYYKKNPEDPNSNEYEDQLTYYRFNLANLGSSQLLKRNYCYRATIKGVRRRGADDEQTAYNDSQPIFLYDIDDEWDTTDDNFVSDKDGNFLVVNRSHLSFSGDVKESDFVELRVSTNPEMGWVMEWVDVPGNQNAYFECTKISDSVIKVGPKFENTDPYVRNGYLQVTATNPKTGAKLTMPIYLMQMTKSFEVTMLTVNDNTGTFDLELNPRGGTVYLNVNTGGTARWEASDDGGTLTDWDPSHVSFTPGQGNTLEIKVPANMTDGPRSATLIVSIKDEDQIYADDGTKIVKDVIINLHQDKSPALLDVIGVPSTGRVDMNCFSIAAGNANGVANVQGFTVKLADKRLKYKIHSTFDYNRDLYMTSGTHRGPGSTNPVYATQPTDGSVKTGQEISGLVDGSMFWLNAFRTGPNDPMIIGTITVTAYSSDASLVVTPEEKSFTVRLLTEACDINDVIIPNGTKYLLITDRNYGAPSRLGPDGNKVDAEYYDYRTNIKITNKDNPTTFSQYKGTFITVATPAAGYPPAVYASSYSPALATIYANFKSLNSNVNDIYSTGTFRAMSYNGDAAIANYLRQSKGRSFLVSPYPKKNGQSLCCWLPYIDTRYCTSATSDGLSYGTVSHYLVSEAPKAGSQSQRVLFYRFINTGFNTYEVWANWGYSSTQNISPTYGVRLVMDITDLEHAKEVYDLQ